MTSKRLLESYLYPLLNQGYIDKIDSTIDRRAKIYYPIITTKKYINLFENGKSNNLSQQKSRIVVKSTIFPSKQHVISKIEPILKYYSENGFIVSIKNDKGEAITIDELVDQYFGNTDDYFEKEDGDESNNHNSNSSNSDSGNDDDDDDANVDTDGAENKTNPDLTDATLMNSNKNIQETEKEKNNFSNNGFSEEDIQKGKSLKQSQQKSKINVNITINSKEKGKKLFDSPKTNKITYSENHGEEQAQNPTMDSKDSKDSNLHTNKEEKEVKKESREEKYLREQEERKNWNIGLV